MVSSVCSLPGDNRQQQWQQHMATSHVTVINFLLKLFALNLTMQVFLLNTNKP